MGCKFAGCGKPIRSQDLCGGHWKQQYLGKSLTPILPGRRNRGRVLTSTHAGCTWCDRVLPLSHFKMMETTGLARSRCARCEVLASHRLSYANYQSLVAAQDGKCAICNTVPDGQFAIDHDHKCCPGQKSCGVCIRGLLCGDCNWGIGLFRDDPARLRSAIRYVSKGTNVQLSA